MTGCSPENKRDKVNFKTTVRYVIFCLISLWFPPIILNQSHKANFKTNDTGRAGITISSGLDLVEVPDPDDALQVIGRLQHVIFTKTRTGISDLYISYYDDDGNVIDVKRDSQSPDSLRGGFTNWDSSAILGIGNEISYADPRAQRLELEDGAETFLTTETLPWLGELHMLAIYCP